MQLTELNGILLMDKPQGFTSHDVVAKLRGILKTKKTGHGGTLDPLATGVLPVFVGGATKASDFAAAQDKEYIAQFRLGYSTDTQDVTGETVKTSLKKVPVDVLEAVLEEFRGERKQTPPMYSAVKVNGKKLYELARKGQETERPLRDITVHELELTDFDEAVQAGVLRCVVSKGTYVRTLINDIGEKLGTYACMSGLRRVRSGAYGISDCHSFDEVAAAVEAGKADSLMLPTDTLFTEYPEVALTEEGMERLSRGAIAFRRMAKGMPEDENVLCRVYYGGRFLMLGQVRKLKIGGMGLFVYKRFVNF